MDQQAAAAVVSLGCPSCGLAWEITARADGSLPQRARCPAASGGCGTLVRVPRAAVAPAASPAPAAAAGGWEAPSQPRRGYEVAEACPDCQGPLTATPRGTRRVCRACVHAVVPAGVSAPYARGEGQARVVRSQAERDLEAIALARRMGVMVAQLERLAADDRLDPESVTVVEWFTAQVRAARSDARLDELAGLLPEAGLRRRRWWQAEPAAPDLLASADARSSNLPAEFRAATAAIEAAGWDDGEEDLDDEDDEDPPPAAAAVPSARPGELTAADALDVCGWQLTPTVGGCQVVEGGRLCGAETRHLITGRYVRDAWVCTRHYYAICKVITDAARQR